MRRLEFVEPNFICDVRDDEGRKYEKWLFCFPDKKALEADLKEKDFKILSIGPYDFKTWKAKANAAAVIALAEKDKEGFEYSNAIWTELKQFLFWISKGKCGYCEQKVTGVYAGDVEHYRPKKKVTGEPTHPGYYWLAYDERNYVPVCQKCNGARAKANHFPLDPTSPRAFKPEDVVKEKPLLINPLGADEPSIHFEFIGPEGGKDFGKLKGITPAGEKSSKLYHLNRRELVEARRETYKDILDHKLLLEADWKGVSEKLMTHWKMGIKEYTLVIRSVLTTWLKEIKEKEVKSAAEKIKAYEKQIAQEKERQASLEDFINNDLIMLRG